MIKILVSGDYSPRARVESAIEANNFESIFKEIKDLNSAADYSIVNFESVVADKTDTAIKKNGPNLKCSPKALEALKWAGFDMLTLANNHFYDYGQSAIIKSFEIIDNLGLDRVGAGVDEQDAVKTLFKDIKGKRFAFINCCENEFSIVSETHGGCNPLDPIKQYYAITEARKRADFVIVIVHGGHEHFQLPSPRMKKTYRFFIDAGADAVINHHQHCFSGFEYYNTKPIVYGLGNLCFDWGIGRKSWHEGYVAELDFDNDNIELKLHPYEQCKLTPTVHFLENRTEFDSDISKLNAIISDDNKLRKKVEEYYEQSSKGYLSVFEPYSNRYMMAAFYRNLIPSTFGKVRVSRVYNSLICESHLDRFRYAVTKKFES